MSEVDTAQEEDAEEVDNFGQGGFNRARKFIWELFEEPNKSKLGKVVISLDKFLDMACEPSLMARTQLMPVELYCTPTAHDQSAHFVLTTHNAGLSCTGQWMYSSSCHQQSYKLSEHRHLDLLKL